MLRGVFLVAGLFLLSGCSSNDAGTASRGATTSQQGSETARAVDRGLKYAECGVDEIGRVTGTIGRAVKLASKGEVSRATRQLKMGSGRAQKGSDCLSGLAALVGENLSSLLAEDEQEEVVLLQGQALSETRDGRSVSNRFESGTNVQVTALSTRTETREMVVLRNAEVEEPDDLKVIGKTYVVAASGGTTLRLGPSASATEVRALHKNETFVAAASVEGHDGASYILVSENNRWVGYVPAKAVKPASAADQPSVVRAAEAPQPDKGAVAVTMNVDTTCRTLQSQARAKEGQSAKDTNTYCRAPDGAWVID